MRPAKDEYYPYLEAYISKVKEETALAALENTLAPVLNFLNTIPVSVWNFAYAADKWTVKELLVHVIDTERIFSYRALAFARGEQQILPAFDENFYTLNSKANERQAKDIIEEFKNVRLSSIALFRGFSEETLQKRGKLPAGQISVNALGFAICGHLAHHLEVLNQRYLK